jgi:hypothetical protein
MVQPTIQLVATDGTVSGSISQYGMIQGSRNVIINYGAHEGELDELFHKLKECLADSEASMRDKLIAATDGLAEALQKGKDVDTIQGYWEQIKEGLKTAGPATTIVATIARLLGFM